MPICLRRSVLLFLLAAATLAGDLVISQGQAAAEKKSQPNIVFIFSDDHAYQALSAYDKRLINTPHIDSIAKQGVRFDHCYVTNSICGPMRAVIQTGKYSHINGFVQNGNKFNGDQWTFPKALQKVGYQTAVIGKWHLGTHQAPQGFNYSEVLPGQGAYYNPDMLLDENGDGNQKRVKHTGYTTDIITDQLLKWMEEKRDPDKPFMVMYQHKAPHREWSPGPEHLTTNANPNFPEPKTLFEDYSKSVKARQTQKMTIANDMRPGADLKIDWAPGNLNAEQRERYLAAFREENEAFHEAKLEGDDRVRWSYQRYMRIYLASIQSVDDNVGRVLKYLEETGLDENTIVIYCSDQGFYLGEHGWYDKRWVYEESLRTPFLVRWPGKVKPGGENNDIVSPVDFAATFCEIAGAETPDDLQGNSLVPVFEGKTPKDWRKNFYYHYYEYPGAHSVRRHYAVVDGRYKLIHFYEKDVDEWELIDLVADPLEMKNFIDKPEYKDVQARLHKELKRLREELKVPHDPGPTGRGKSTKRRKPKKTALKEAFRAEKAAGQTSTQLDPSNRTFTIGGHCRAASGTGVLVAQGGGACGYSLYLKQGVPTFTVRNEGAADTVAAKESIPLDESVHLAAILDHNGQLRLYVNGKLAASGPGRAIERKPSDRFSVGFDSGEPGSGSYVGEYESESRLDGQLSDVRVYWGEIDEKSLQQWVAHSND